MRKIEYKVGNLFAGPESIILHGCNAQGVMGSGFAKTLRALYPKAYEEYHARHLSRPLQLGEVIAVDTGGKCILNAITQEFYGQSPLIRYMSYDAVDVAFNSVNQLVNARGLPNTTTIALPLIGAGLGGGNWKAIAAIIEHVAYNFQPVVYVQTQAELDKIQ